MKLKPWQRHALLEWLDHPHRGTICPVKFDTSWRCKDCDDLFPDKSKGSCPCPYFDDMEWVIVRVQLALEDALID